MIAVPFKDGCCGTSSKLPKPPGRPTNAPARFAISTLRSCIEFTTILWPLSGVAENTKGKLTVSI